MNMLEYIQSFTFDYATFITVNLLLSSVVILLERKNPTAALAWLFFLNLFPGLGFFFYILLAQNISKRKIFKYTSEEERLYVKFLKQQRRSIQNNTYDFHSGDVAEHKDMILFHNRLSDSILSQNNDVTIYSNGNDKFDQLFKDIESASHHIHLLYYIFKNDRLGNKLMDLLVKRAEEGIEVRLLIDAMGGRSLRKSQIRRMEEHGVHVAFFFPSRFKYFNLKGNYRNHRKLAIIDGRIGYIGGLNVGDEYLGRKKRFGFWRDTHLRVIGDSVLSMQIRFILDWRNASKHSIYLDMDYLITQPNTPKTTMQIVASGPDSINEQIKQGYLQMIHKAKEYIYIQTPYFIPDESLTEGLKIAAASGVDVRIMIPNKPDHPFVYWATHSYCGDLIPYGVKIYTYEKGFLHAKTIVVDNIIGSVGTCNFDIRSFRLNFEVNAFMYDRRKCIELRKLFEDDLLVSHQLTLSKYKNRSFMIKTKESISRLFSPVL